MEISTKFVPTVLGCAAKPLDSSTVACLVGNPDGVGGDRLPKARRRGQNERRGGLISSVRAHWGPSCRHKLNTRPCADPAPGYELWVSSQSRARASFLKLVASFAHSARRDEFNFEGTGRSIDGSGVLWCALGLSELNRPLPACAIVILGIIQEWLCLPRRTLSAQASASDLPTYRAI